MKEKRCVVPARPLDIPHTRPAQASLTLRPAGLLSRLKRPLSRGSSPSGSPAEPLVSYQINRQLSGWNPPPLVFRAFGAHGQEETSRPPFSRYRHPRFHHLDNPCWRGARLTGLAARSVAAIIVRRDRFGHRISLSPS